MSAAPPPRFSTTVEDEDSARNDASRTEGAKRTPQDLLSSLAARERSARERAAEADVAAQRAGDHRRAAEERLARHRDGRRAPRVAEAPVQLEILEPLAPVARPRSDEASASDLELVAQIEAAERNLARLVAEEHRLAEEMAALGRQTEQQTTQLGPVEAEIEQLRALEADARERLEAARSAVGEASAHSAEAQTAARQEAQQEREATDRALAADEQLEEIVSARASAFQRAIEHASLEQDASARASAARRTAQQAAAQRLAAEQSLDGNQRAERLARLRAAIESSIEAASEGEGIEGEAVEPAPTSRAEALDAGVADEVEISRLPAEAAGPPAEVAALEAPAELPAERPVVAEPHESAPFEEPSVEERAFAAWPQSSETPADSLASESDEVEESERPAESQWWLAGTAQDEEGWDEADESNRADEADQRFLETLFSEDAFRGEAESALADSQAEDEARRLDDVERPEPVSRPPVLSPLRPRPEAAPRRDAPAPRRERAAAELARIERVASQQIDAVRRARQAEGERVEAERDAYETAASQWRSRQRASNRGPGLYAEHDYAWEEQAAIGVQRKLAREDEVDRRRRSAQAAAEQATAAQRAAEQLRAPSTAARDALLRTVIVSVAMGLMMILLAWIVIFPREQVFVALPASPPLASLEPTLPDPTPPAPVTTPVRLQPEAAVSSVPTEPVAPEPESPSELESGSLRDVAAAAVTPAPAPAPSARLGAAQPQLRDEDWPAWRRYAVPAADAGDRPIIAIVIDDMGNNREVCDQVVALPAPITVSFFPWVQRLERQAQVAREAGHEVMGHVPMEPQARSQDPGPNYLGMSQSAQEIRERLRWNLDKFAFGIVGINNHMGSRFTASGPGMGVVMAELLKRQMLFLDSRTTRDSVGARMAAEFGLPYAVNDLFLDNEVSSEGVMRRLDELELRARRKGSAIAIGHPHRETVDALRTWIPRAQKRGFVLVPLSAVVKHQMGRRAAAAAATSATP